MRPYSLANAARSAGGIIGHGLFVALCLAVSASLSCSESPSLPPETSMSAIVESQLDPGKTNADATKSADDFDPQRLMLLQPAAALDEARTLYERTPRQNDARRWAIINLAGKLQTPETVDFLFGRAIEPLPPPAPTSKDSSMPADQGNCGLSDFEDQLVLRLASIRSLANMQGSPRDAARQALLNLVGNGERIIRREAAAALLLSSPDGDSVAIELRRMLPTADQDVLSFKRRRDPEPGPLVPSPGSSTKRTKTNESAPTK